MSIYTAIIVLIITIIFNLIFVFFKKPKNPSSPSPGQLSLQTRNSDMDLIYSYINRCFLKTLSEFSKKDWTLIPENSKTYASINIYQNKYSDLIRALLVSGYYIRNDGEIKYTLFDIFIEKIYLLYLAETPEHIKMMLFNYESGYDVDGYFSSNKKKIKKSAIHFITGYVRNKLWIRYSENDANRTLICNDEYNDPYELDNRLKIYDDIKLRQVNLDIYHTTDNSVEMEKYLHPEQKPIQQQPAEQPKVKEQNANMFKVDPKTLN